MSHDATGMHGFFHRHSGFSSLVIVDQFNVQGVRSFKTENDAPVGPHRYGSQPLQVAFEWMQAIAGNFQSSRRGGGIENREDSFNGFQQVRPYPAPVVAFIKPLQAPVSEAP